MRCNNCGFENANDAHHCVKCNMLLDAAETKRAERAAPPLREGNPPAKRETFFAGTIADSQPPAAGTIADSSLPADHGVTPPPAYHTPVPPSSDHRPDQDASTSAPLISCPHPDCGYPYSSELKACPRCKRPAATANPAAANYTADTRSDTKPVSTPKQNPIKGTIDPYRIKAAPEPPPPSCWLLPIAKAGEKPPETPQPVALTYETQPIDLNRDTLEPGNTSITGKVQAQLSFKDGAWQLKDQSDLQTTFLQVSTETILKEGDIILFGDRKFIFSRSNPQEE